MQSVSVENDGYNFLLVNVDVFSKFAIVIPLKSKNALDVKRGFEKSVLNRKAKAIQTDRGIKFFNHDLQLLFKWNHIKHFASHNYDVKAAIAERILRLLKARMWQYFMHHNTRRYVECLPNLVNSYNTSFHRSIVMSPIEGSNINNENNILKWFYGRRISKPHLKFKLNDTFRVARYCRTFDKGYFPNWTE